MSFVYKPEFLYLTTTGRKTGQPREIEIWFMAHAGCYYLIAGEREKTQWVQNLQANPQVRFWVEGQFFQGMARPVFPSSEPDLCAAVTALFNARYSWSDGLIVELRPITSSNP